MTPPFDGHDAERRQAEANAWNAANAKALPPEELKPIPGVSLDAPGRKNADGAHAALHDSIAAPEAHPLADRNPAQVNPKDAPADYDRELGRVVDWAGGLDDEPEDAAKPRWVRLTTDLLLTLGATSGYAALMPMASPPQSAIDAAKGAIDSRLLLALPELEALHRKLCTNWREITLRWLEGVAKRKVELRYRAANEKSKDSVTTAEAEQMAAHAPEQLDGKVLVNLLEPSHATSAEAMYAILKPNPPDGFSESMLKAWLANQARSWRADVPVGLSVEMLAAAAALVSRPRSKGQTPATLVSKIEEWAMDPGAFLAWTRQLAEDTGLLE